MSGSEERARQAQILVRLTADEAARVASAAAVRGCSRQDVLRAGGIPDGSPGQLTASSWAVPALVGNKEIAALLGGITKQQAHSITHRPGFPDPVQHLAAGPVWLERDVLDWKADNG